MVPCYSSHTTLNTVEGQLPTHPITAPPPDYLLPVLAKDVPPTTGAPSPKSESLLALNTDSIPLSLPGLACFSQTSASRVKAPFPFAPFLPLRFPCGSDGTDSTCKAGDPGSLPGWGRSPREGNGNPLWYSCLENPTDRGTWWATVHGVAKSRRQLSNYHFSTFASQHCLAHCRGPVK